MKYRQLCFSNREGYLINFQGLKMRALWKGYISFGLINIPVQLHSADHGTDLHFKLLDVRDKSKIKFERINTHTGEEVPWNKVVKAYELSKGNYVVINPEEIGSPKNSKHINIEGFININEINQFYFDKPYYLFPDNELSKSYVLLREVLKKTGKGGVAKIIICTREHIVLIYPHENILILQLLRFTQELIDLKEFGLNQEKLKSNLVSKQEIELAEKLIASMTQPWKLMQYYDEFREKMLNWIKSHAKNKRVITFSKKKSEKNLKVQSNIVQLLKQSLSKSSNA